MPVPVTIPRLGWNMEEGTFVEWLKADGDAVSPGEMLYRLEGEKAVEEIEAFDGGTLFLPTGAPKPGDRVLVGAVIGYILQPGEANPGSEPAVPAPPAATPSPPQAEPAASPAVRRLARERGIDLRHVRGSGAGGRVLPQDIDRPVSEGPTISPRARRLAERHGLDYAHLRGSGRTGRIREHDIIAAISHAPPQPGVIPLTASRKVIAARMVESRATTAPVTLTSVGDATNLVNLRNQFRAAGDERPIPSYTDFLLKLTAAALQQHPLLASHWTDGGIRPADRIDIGVAVDTDSGLLVPVVRDVPALGLREVAARTRDLIDRARGGRLTTRDMEGGCFTITNLGAYGIDAFTPIINPPQCAILGVGRIERRPVMDGDRVVGREQVTLSLTFDHRIVDGAPAARFLQTLARMIETPAPWVSS